MDFSFENSTMAAIAAEIAKEAPRRKRKASISYDKPENVKRQKLDIGSLLNTRPPTTDSESSFNSPGSAHFTFSSATSRSSTPQSTLKPEKNKGGRPRSKVIPYPRNKQLKVSTRIRKDRPFTKELPCEIWQGIFGFCSPSFLLKACTVKYFDEILARNEVTWKLARQRHFDPDMPDPPPGLSEKEYAKLLTGTGCQNCDDTETRRTYWAYQRRWCKSCHTENIVAEKQAFNDSVFERGGQYRELRALMLKCIPVAKYDSWVHYQWVGDYDEPPAWGQLYPNGQRSYYQRSKTDDLMVEFNKSSLNEKSTQEEIDAFFNPKIAANKDYVSKLQAVEDWCETFRVVGKEGKDALKAERAKYYKDQASLMEPPLEPEALAFCESYKRAARIAREPTAKSWSILQDKLCIERVVAEEKLAKKRHRDAVQEFRKQLRQDYDENAARRKNKDAPEQLFVFELAEAVVKDLQQLKVEIADEDLIHVFFRRVYDAYQASDSKPEGKHGKYRLLMDDVRQIYYKQFRSMIKEEIQPGITHPAMQVKCPGCPDSFGTRSFGEHMRHIHGTHRYDGSELSRFSVNRDTEEFAWMYLEWPRNLPILAPHHKSTGCWNPDDYSAYQYKDYVRSFQWGLKLYNPKLHLVRQFRATQTVTTSVHCSIPRTGH